MKSKKNSIKENLKTLLFAVVAAVIIRSFFFEPFSIPSGSMYPTLKVGDYLFVSKYHYGFSKHSFPFSPPIIKDRIFYKVPERGDVVVFKTPEDNSTDYIKRLIGLPGDRVKILDDVIHINDTPIKRVKINSEMYKFFDVERFNEKLSNGKNYMIYEMAEKISYLDTNNFKEIIVPDDHFFVLGDNRDNSQDSRFIGTIPKKNLVGKAIVVFLSFDTDIGSWWKFWTWYPALRKDRILFSLLPDEE